MDPPTLAALLEEVGALGEWLFLWRHGSKIAPMIISPGRSFVREQLLGSAD